MRRTASSLASLARAASAPASATFSRRFSPVLAQQWRQQQQRMYTPAAGAPLDPAKLTIEPTAKPSALKEPKDLVFGRTFTGAFLFCV